MGVTVYFQLGLINYNTTLRGLAGPENVGQKAYKFVSEGGALAAFPENEVFHKLLDNLATNLGSVIIVSYLNLLFPLNLLMEFMFTSNTNRKKSDLSADFFNELILFIMTIWVQYLMLFEFPQLNTDYNKL